MKDDMKQEYFIGAKIINKLRYKVPTFMYTLGIFGCDPFVIDGKICTKDTPKVPFMIAENIPGKTVTDMIESRELSFKSWLNIFMQLLASLELAQRECQFTHYDLHTQNVMVRKVEKMSYCVELGNTIIHFKDVTEIPVIIDFGLASVSDENKHYGSEIGMEKFNILQTMTPGHDMYKFWLSSLYFFMKSHSPP